MCFMQMPYRIGGGFKAWGADGLGVKLMRPETPLTILKEVLWFFQFFCLR